MPENAPSFKRFIKWLWILLLAPIVGLTLLMFMASWGWFGPLPTVEELENPKNYLASEIISSDGKQIGKYFLENRTHARYEELSPYLPQALIATEDERFLSHSGIDFKGLARAVAKLGTAGGASTISQQLAKMLFTEQVAASQVQRVFQKFKEWVIAVELERRYTKEEILVMYLNRYDFLNLAVGIESAAQIYFNTSVDSLSVLESATLVGMLKNSSYYNPRRFPERVEQRRNVVLSQMVRNEFLSSDAADSLMEVPMELDYQRAGHNDGLAPYFRAHLRSYMRDWISKNPKPDGTKYNLYTDGLKIYTTIDSRMQQYAEESMRAHMSNLQRVFRIHWKGRTNAPFEDLDTKAIDRLMRQAMRRTDRYRIAKEKDLSNDSIELLFNTPREMTVFSWEGEIDTVMTPMDSIAYYKFFLQAGVLSMDPQTGFIKAWVGGIDHKHFKYDHVYQAKRQVGSTFKPFVYVTAIDQKKYSPCYKVPNVPVRFEKEQWGLLKDWQPSNSDDEYGGELSLKQGLAESVNTITAFLMKQVRPRPVIEMARNLGVEGDIPEQPAICLGTPDLSLAEMVGAYGTFANQGIYTKPTAVLRIEDKYGVVLADFTPMTREVMSAETAYTAVNLLEGVTQYGTGVRLRTQYGNYSYLNDVVTGYPYKFTNPIAGKTGTTQNHSDGWFMGMVPNLVTGVWVGAEDRAAHFRSIAYGQGATMALPIWAMYMNKCYADPGLQVSQDEFNEPEGGVTIQLDCDLYDQQQKANNVNFDEIEF